MFVGFWLPGEESHHITLTRNGKRETRFDYQALVHASALAALWWNAGPVAVQYDHKLGYFEDSACWHAAVLDGPIFDFQRLLVSAQEEESLRPNKALDFIPHTTLGYGEKPDGNPYRNKKVAFTHLSVVSRVYGRTDLLL